MVLYCPLFPLSSFSLISFTLIAAPEFRITPFKHVMSEAERQKQLSYNKPYRLICLMVYLSNARPDASAHADASPVNSRNWTRLKMVRFLELLAETGSVSVAAKCVGMSRQSAYRLRARLLRQPFDLAWEAALEFGLQQLAHAALDRALNGILVPVFYKGEKVGERRVFNERATLNLMLAMPHIGKDHAARDFASRNWVGLLKRIADEPVVWTEEEEAGIDADHPLNHNDDEPVEEDDAEDYSDSDDDDEDTSEQAELARESERFIRYQSHYATGDAPPPKPHGRKSWFMPGQRTGWT